MLRQRQPSPIEATRHLEFETRTADSGELLLDATLREPTGQTLRRDSIRCVDALDAATRAYGRLHDEIMIQAHQQQFSRLHAALVDLPEGRVLVAGVSGAGKTSLAVELGLRGRLVSDEGVLLAPDGRVLGLPRRVHVKAAGTSLIPAELLTSAVELGYSPPLFALDPVLVSNDPAQVLAPALRSVDLVVVLDPDSAPGPEAMSEAQVLDHLLADAHEYLSSAEPAASTQARLVHSVALLARTVRSVRLRARTPGLASRVLQALS